MKGFRTWISGLQNVTKCLGEAWNSISHSRTIPPNLRVIRSIPPNLQDWKHPHQSHRQSVFKLNFNASFNKSDVVEVQDLELCKSGLSFVLRNDEGSLIMSGHMWTSCRTSTEAEFRAALLALRAVTSSHYNDIVLESDCKSVIDVLDFNRYIDDCFEMTREAWQIMRKMEGFKAEWVPRGLNKAAYKLAVHARLSSSYFEKDTLYLFYEEIPKARCEDEAGIIRMKKLKEIIMSEKKGSHKLL